MPPSKPTETAPRDPRSIEWLVPSDSAEYLEPQPNAPRYTKPFTLPSGVEVDLNGPAFGPSEHGPHE